jgi:hypothetical protein
MVTYLSTDDGILYYLSLLLSLLDFYTLYVLLI